MRKISSILTLLLLCCSVIVQAAVSFDSSKKYYIIENTTGRYVASGITGTEGHFGLKPTDQKGDRFTFTAVGDKWTLQTYRGDNFGATTWNTANTSTQWTIAEAGDGLYTFYQNSSGNTGYLNYQSNHDPSLYVNGESTTVNKFRIVEASPFWDKPEFGGTVWTWNTSTNVFDADGQNSTASPGRLNNKGPLYKFDNVGTVSVSTGGNNSSDKGGVWVIGSSSNVTCPLGTWAGGVLIEDEAALTISWGTSLKGDEAARLATFWVDGTLTVTGRQDFNMNDGTTDGGAQKWYIGDRGRVNTMFTSATKGGRKWKMQVLVADDPEIEGVTRTTKTVTKQVMSWSADIFSQIDELVVCQKDAAGSYTILDNNTVVTHDANGLYVTYTALVNTYNYQVNILRDVEGGAVTYNGNTYQNNQSFDVRGVLNLNDLTIASVDGYRTPIVDITRTDPSHYVINVTYPAIVPFVPTTISDNTFAADTKWYRLVIDRPTKKYSHYNAATGQIDNLTNKMTDVNSYFCFVRDGEVENGFRIYNMAVGPTKAIHTDATNSNDATVDFTAEGSVFVVEQNIPGADGYQFKAHGVSGNYPYFHDLNNKIGVWVGDANAPADAGSRFLIYEGEVTAEELATLTADYTVLNEIYAKMQSCTLGSGIGQYTEAVSGTLAAALNQAQTVINSGRTDIAYQSNINAAVEALRDAFAGLTITSVPTGKYYRLRVASQSAENDNYMSAYGNGTSLNTKVVTSQAPTIFYLTADNKLQAVYNDAYISNEAASNSAPLATTTVADDAMVWTITGSEVTPGTYNLKAGNNDLYLYDWTTYSRNNTLVANNKNDRRCQWTIEEVELDENLIKEFDLGLLNFSQSLETIPLIEGAEIICPSEYTYTPEELNAAIATIKAVTSDNTLAEVKSALNSNEYGIASHYKGLCDTHGEALSVSLTMKGKYSTLIAPINYTCPTNWVVYSCSATEGNVLTLTTFNNAYKNKPLIIEYTDEATMPTQQAPKTFQLIGYSNGAGTENVSEGFLTGVLSAETTTIPTGSYVLALDKNTGKQAFYKTNGTVVCPKYRCYLTVPTTLTNAFYFDNEGTTTGIEAIFGGENEEVVIYDLSGKRLSRLQKGVNIVNGHKVIVK